jgi:hypothetical protein
MPCGALPDPVGQLDGGDRGIGTALGHDVPRASFAAPALRGYAELELDVVEAHAGAGVAGDFSVGDTVADADDHGNSEELATDW